MESRTRHRALQRGLIGLNVALLALLAWGALTPRAGAQGQARLRGQYVMVGGKLSGSASSAIYIIDGVNRELAALRWDRSGQRLEAIGWRSLDADSAEGARNR